MGQVGRLVDNQIVSINVDITKCLSKYITREYPKADKLNTSQDETTQTQEKPPFKWRSLLLAFAISFAVAGVGSGLTELNAWYFQLKQPDWKPPDAAFGAIWTVIFSLSAISAWLGWHAIPSRGMRRLALIWWAMNAFFNVFWSLIYFKWQRPDWALFELPFIWLTVLVLIVIHWKYSRSASLLLLPYLVWVSLAGGLNWGTVQLNGPFV